MVKKKMVDKFEKIYKSYLGKRKFVIEFCERNKHIAASVIHPEIKLSGHPYYFFVFEFDKVKQ